MVDVVTEGEVELVIVDDGDGEGTFTTDTFGRAVVPDGMRDAEPEDLAPLLEAICFSLNRSVTLHEVAALLERPVAVVTQAATILADELRTHGLMLQRHGEEIQLVTRASASWVVQRALNPERPGRLSRPAMETLAIVAYRQPITKAAIEYIRGVGCEAVLEGLERRGLIAECGRQETPGQPRLFGTTMRFLQLVGLEKIEDLPPLPEGSTGDEELSSLPWQPTTSS